MNALLIAWLLTDIVATYGVWHFWHSIVPLAPAAASPRAVILIAIKGAGPTTSGFLESICQQRYPGYRLVFSVESEADPARGLIEAIQSRYADRIDIDMVVAGPASRSTQKVHNLRAALGRLRSPDRVVVFADADTLLPPDWLEQLIRPIALGDVAASTGYRWPLPGSRALATLVGAAADLSITTAARSWRWNVCWGGSCAVGRDALDAIDLASVWNGVASDDVTLTRALRSHGFRINAPLRVLVPSPVDYTWSGLFRFARRQHLMVRTYSPWHWLLGGSTLCVPVAGAIAALFALARDGNRMAAGTLVASVALLQLRMRLRRRIAGAILPGDAIRAALATIHFSSWAWPLVNLIHCCTFVASCFGNSFTWAGIRYRLAGREVRIRPGDTTGT